MRDGIKLQFLLSLQLFSSLLTPMHRMPRWLAFESVGA